MTSRTSPGAMRIVLLGLVVLCGIGALIPSLSDPDEGDRSPAADAIVPEPDSVPASESGSKSEIPPATEIPPKSSTTAPDSTAPNSTAPNPSAPTGADGTHVVVTHVVDGDTIDVSTGERVRLIGIDTPERGQCGFSEAAFALSSLVAGRTVILIPGARDDTDRYGRLLRYVEVAGVDVNRAMIVSGRAIARYDSRDGYGRHPREEQYREADLASASTNNCDGDPPSSVVADSGPGRDSGAVGGSGTDPDYGTCRQAKAAGAGPYRRGIDPEYEWYRDADADGTVCE